MAEDAQKTVSQTDSRNFYGVTFTQDASTPVFKTDEAHGLSVRDKISITKSSSAVITGEGTFNFDLNDWEYASGTEYIIAKVGNALGGGMSAIGEEPKEFTVEGQFDTSSDTSTRTIEYHSTSPPKEEEKAEGVVAAAAEGSQFQQLLTAKAEWKPHQIAKAGDIAKLAEAATGLAETVKSALYLSRNGMEVVKLLAVLQNINPLLTALDLLADEVLKQINDLKNAGYFYLYIDPYYKGNVKPKASFDLGFEQLRDEGGKRKWQKKDKLGNWNETVDVPTQADLDLENARPMYVLPRRLIPGGYNWFDPIPDPLDSESKYPRFTTKDVVDEFVKAFEDEGDVPRYRKLGKVSELPAAGKTVWDVDGQPYEGWDPKLDFGLELFDMGVTHPDVVSGLIKDYEASRKPINSRETPGKPNIKGNTIGMTGVGAIAIIIGASNFDKFTTTFNEFAKMFSDIPELTPGITGQNLLDTLTSILDPPSVKLNIVEHDLKYGQFVPGDIIGGEKYRSIGEITSVNTSSMTKTEIKGEKVTTILDDMGEPLKKADGTIIEVIEDIDGNPETEKYPKGRYQDLEIMVKPINTSNKAQWIGGDMILSMEERGKVGNSEATTAETGIDYYNNYVFIGQETKELPKNQRVYPKVAYVLQEVLQELPDPVPPDFGGMLIDDVVPGWGEFFQELENFVKQIKGYISNSGTFIQEMIDMIAEIEAYLNHLVELIDKFLEFFRITLPSEGVYALYIPNQPDGNEGIKKEISEATGIPELDYASGILFVGVEGGKLIAGGGSKNPIDLLALVLGLLNNTDDADEATTSDKTAEEAAADLSAALGQAAEGSDKDEWKEKSTGEKLTSMLVDRIL